ncbi:proteasome maturation factor UMP1 [Rhypophila decipiens]|uniref:Proteasome maturation factor UMP1 n=1 Tax=Rhypophila decipiens TaxID=261697 RepID=A0AAN6YH97_9PEZI|nr:proteasome maturation factor UMP1 [Rhypophila decipiens]
MSLRIVPEDNHASSFSHIPSKSLSAPSAPGLHDTLRAGVGPSPHDADKAISAHPLEARLKSWEATREALRMETLRRTYGIAEPVRRGMELKIARENTWRPMCLSQGGKTSVHEEILAGRDETITWEDVFTNDDTSAFVSVQDEIERKLVKI